MFEKMDDANFAIEESPVAQSCDFLLPLAYNLPQFQATQYRHISEELIQLSQEKNVRKGHVSTSMQLLSQKGLEMDIENPVALDLPQQYTLEESQDMNDDRSL